MPVQFLWPNNDFRLSYAEYGDPKGFPILIQHGMIASIRDGHLFRRLIQCGARLICAARPGYGQSSPYLMNDIGEWGNIIRVLVDRLELTQFDVFGISSGAPCSYALGHACPDRVRNIFILSGTPALYDKNILALWPYPTNENATIAEMQALSHQLFFSNLSPQELDSSDIQDSMQNNCFGIAQDLVLRVRDWGFNLADVQPPVYMRHSKSDNSVPFPTAEMTAQLLPNCKFEATESVPHFSQEVLDDYIETVLAQHYAR